jgi:DNA-binding NtrC family response regulator
VKTATFLVLQNDKKLESQIKTVLGTNGYTTIVRDGLEHFTEVMSHDKPDLVLLSTNQPQLDAAFKLIRDLKRNTARVPVILITRYSSEVLAVNAFRAGVDDYLTLPLSDKALMKSIARVRSRCGLTNTADAVAMSRVATDQGMIGESRAMQKVKAYIARVAVTDSTVLITGETGTGKELAAEMIHLRSKRRAKPMIRVNCSALPDSLVESELFGYDRGAFTGAVATKKGKFEMAGGSSVFLDEIGDMNTYAQAKVLRSIENKEVCRLGGNSEIPVDVRVIAATNRNPEELVSGRKFREDLYYRLNVARLHLPPLREHKQDIPLLVDFAIAHLNRRFGRKIQGLSERAMAVLLQFDWPGNVRELINILEATYINLPREKIDYADLPQLFRKKLEDTLRLPQEERRHIVSALLETRWNKSSAAQKLKWSRMTLYRKITKYHIVEKRHPPR